MAGEPFDGVRLKVLFWETVGHTRDGRIGRTYMTFRLDRSLSPSVGRSPSGLYSYCASKVGYSGLIDHCASDVDMPRCDPHHTYQPFSHRRSHGYVHANKLGRPRYGISGPKNDEPWQYPP